jgi:hypothetical protein
MWRPEMAACSTKRSEQSALFLNFLFQATDDSAFANFVVRPVFAGPDWRAQIFWQ